MLLRKHLWIPLDPRYGLAKTLPKPAATVREPGIVVAVGVTKILLDGREKLYRLASHLRATRRSSSSSVIRSTFPARYAFQRESSNARSSALTDTRSSTASRHNSSANFNFWRLGSFRSSGNCARAMNGMCVLATPRQLWPSLAKRLPQRPKPRSCLAAG